MSTYDWRPFLKRWSREWLSLDDYRWDLPDEVAASGWLGYPGATEEQLASAERRLGVSLPPSYRQFLATSNGWRRTSPFITRVWGADEIEWLAALDPELIAIYTRGAPPDSDDALYLPGTLQVSGVGDEAFYLLNPGVVGPDGEWEAWFFAHWVPGWHEYPSFWDLMRAEHETFLRLRLPPAASGSQLSMTTQRPEASHHEARVTHPDWQALLSAWFREIVTLRPEGVEDVPPQLLAAGRLGASGAGEELPRTLERRLGTALPPSYRAFLRAADGCWLFNGYTFPYRFWSAAEADWFAARNQEWIDARTAAARDAEPVPVPDEVYFTYGSGQNPLLVREEYLRTALEVSDRGENASIFLLNPRVVTAEGEWEAWYLDGPYAFRYRSFWEMLQAQHEDFLRATAP